MSMSVKLNHSDHQHGFAPNSATITSPATPNVTKPVMSIVFIGKSLLNHEVGLSASVDTSFDPIYRQTSRFSESGSSLILLPVAAKIALQSAGGMTDTPASPADAGGALLSTT
jgi:hypothetical protein